jgi:hypothetical protein
MCDECDEVDVSVPFDLATRRRLIDATRDMEADLPGDRVPEEVWRIFLGEETGALAWPHHERMARSWEAAAVLLSVTSGVERRPG